jgi:hypothetical protein
MMTKIVAALACLAAGKAERSFAGRMCSLSQAGRGDLRTSTKRRLAGTCERIFPTIGANMNQHINSFGAMIRRPSAFLPLAVSFTALALVLVHIAIFGAGREADEGATAHIWQLLMAGQMPVLAFFAIKWLPRAPRETLCVLALQAGAVLASIAPVFFLNL